MSIQVDAKVDGALAVVREVHAKISTPEGRRSLMKIVGVAAEQVLRAFWFRRDAEDPNKMGWPRQHFWARIAKRTAFDPSKTTENAATVAVADPALAAKINGATIRPTAPRKFLALPMNDEAYGVLPRSGIIPGLFFLRSTAANGGFLVRHGGGAFNGTGANLIFYYRLMASVRVPKDPRALPSAAELAPIGQAAQDFFRRRGATGAIPAGGAA